MQNQLNIEEKLDISSAVATLPRTRSWDETLAKWVSEVLSPPVLALFGIILAALAIQTGEGWFWTGLYISWAILLPIVYILLKVRQGEISDFHMRIREERIRPMILMVICSIVAWSIMWVASAPKVLTIFAGAGVFQTAYLFLITLRWKISGHGTAVASLAVFLLALYGVLALPSVLAVPLVAWARVRLNRHDLAQTIGGILVGGAFMVLVLAVISVNCHGINLQCQ